MRYEDWTSAGGDARATAGLETGATLQSGDRRCIAVRRPALHCGLETSATLRRYHNRSDIGYARVVVWN
jgi:hypothetical protein